LIIGREEEGGKEGEREVVGCGLFWYFQKPPGSFSSFSALFI